MLTLLYNLQKKEGLTDSGMAKKLGCTREWWNQVKNGRQPLSNRLVINAMKAFPILTIDAMKYLQESNHEEVKDADRN